MPRYPSDDRRAQGLGKRYRDGEQERCVLNDVSLDIAPGEFVVLTGRSGAGKTTLLSLLGALDASYDGSLQIDGVELRSLGERARAQLRSSQLGFVFQSHNLLPRMTALQNVLLPALFADGARPSVADARQLLDRVGLAALENSPAAKLSGGEGQRVAIARAMLLSPRLLLADEPTGSLDGQSAGEIAALLLAVSRDRGTTVVVASHDPELWSGATRQLSLSDGRLS